jgi:CO/xanthine dehydrogenase FAD-binding subunit
MEVFLPRSLEEALALKAEHPDAVPVAGGTDLWVAVNFGTARPPALLDLSRVGELKTWSTDDGRIRLGAGVTFARIERELAEFRPLAEASRSVGSPQIRNRATIGGNLATASPAGDSIPVLAAYGATVVVASRNGERSAPWDRFFTGPKRTTLAPDELIVGVEWQRVDAPGSFAKVGTRNAMVIAIAGLCLQLDPAARSVRLALGSVAPTVVRAPEAESFAAGAVAWDEPDRPLPDDAVAEFGRLAAAAAHPIDDVRSSAGYRRHAVEVLARRALLWTLDDRRAAA